MSDELREQMQNELNLRETEDLLEIWYTNDHEEWSDIAFEVIGEILRKRIGEIPAQEFPEDEQEDENTEDDGLDEWEAKLLDDENQPALYDTLEVLRLKDNINRVAVAAVILYTLFGISNLQIVRAFLRGVPLSSELLSFLPTDIYTLLVYGLQIVVIYFPLKALLQILRILMEMEFASRKTN